MHKGLMVVMLTLFANIGMASTVLQVDMDYMLSEARLIFEGEVLSRQSQWNDERTGIFTAIVFRVDDVVKGAHTENTITLNFSGGIVGDQGMRVSSMVYPKVGEKGIYFVSDPNSDFVNPLVGWSQGHFRVERDENGDERVMTEARAPVLDIVPPSLSVNADPQSARSTKVHVAGGRAYHERNTPFSEGVAKGVSVGNKSMSKQQAMKKAAFKRALKDQLAVIKQ